LVALKQGTNLGIKLLGYLSPFLPFFRELLIRYRGGYLSNYSLLTHLAKVKNQAGKRYTPKLHVELPISEIFDGISRTPNFYLSIRKKHGELGRGLNNLKQKYQKKALQKINQSLKSEVKDILYETKKVKEFNTVKIPWKRILLKVQKSQRLVWKLTGKLRAEEESIATAKHGKYANEINNLYRLAMHLEYFNDLATSSKALLANLPFLFLSGNAGIGKTHLLCDLIESRISNGFPALLFFGDTVVTEADPLVQFIKQLGWKLDKRSFLRFLNNAGKKAGVRAVLAVDALNETRIANYWKRNLGRLVDEIKKYPNLALVVSIRNGFEKEVLTTAAKKIFVHEEHHGFEFREWEAVNKFFMEFGLPLPQIPLLQPEFQTPLFLLLFCKAFEEASGTGKQVFKGHEGATFIFETFVDSVSKRVEKQFKINQPPLRDVWNGVIKPLAQIMVEQNTSSVSEGQLIGIVKSSYPLINHNLFILELERNLLLTKTQRYIAERHIYEGFEFRFPFQRFSDHLIARYMFKKYEEEFGKGNKNLNTAKKFFSKRRKLGKYLSKPWNIGIAEALSVQCPEHLEGGELLRVAPYLVSLPNAFEAFAGSITWRKPTAFSPNLKSTLAFINYFSRTRGGHDYLLNAFLSVASVPQHPFNAYFLHEHLSKFTLARRDAWWSSRFLNAQYGSQGPIDSLISWAWSDYEKTHIDDESIRLCSIVLCWFFTSSNRVLRDRATKALASLLTGRLNIVLDLLKLFKEVNDPYILERLFAVAYGSSVLSPNEKEGLKALSHWIYRNIFKAGDSPVHVLTRDYARGVIEFAQAQGLVSIALTKAAKPPFSSKWPSVFPSTDQIERLEFNYKDKSFKDYFWAQNSIIMSMQPEGGQMSRSYGDFGRYTFQSALSEFALPKKITFQKLSNWAVKRIFDLGYDVNMHGEFDRSIGAYSDDRLDSSRTERIGKKYQWLSFHELLARVSDHYQLKDKGNWQENRTLPFEGPWQLWIRDIDPTYVLGDKKKKPEDFPNLAAYKSNLTYDPWRTGISHTAWLKSRDLPNLKRLLQIVDTNRNTWLALESFIDWKEGIPPEEEDWRFPSGHVWLRIRGYLVKNNQRNQLFRWGLKQNFMGNWMPEPHDINRTFLGEFPWAPAYLSQDTPYYGHEGWTNNRGEIPANVLPACDHYFRGMASRDSSIEGPVSVSMPNKLIVTGLNLTQSHSDGRFFDSQGNLVAFDPSVFDDSLPNSALINQNVLRAFLESEEYGIVWTLLGEKRITGIERNPRWQEINGAFTLTSNNKMKGSWRGKFMQSPIG
jgi:hypothetical protein